MKQKYGAMVEQTDTGKSILTYRNILEYQNL